MTSGTYGPPRSISSTPSDLSELLANKLRARTASLGSTLYTLTWKARVTPSGRSIYALRASARRTSDNACSGWPTPAAQEAGGTEAQFLARKEKARENGASLGVSLTSLSLMAMRAAGWPTPTKGNGDGGHVMGPETTATGRRPDGTKAQVTLPGVAALSGWPTTRASDGEKNVRSLEGALAEIKRKGSPQDLSGAVSLVTGPARLTASGVLLTGYSAQTLMAPAGGQLNPSHSRWLMALPPEWDAFAPTVTRSSRKSQRSS